MREEAIAARHLLSQVGTQLVGRGEVTWAKKAAWLRNQPHTAVFPHNGQIETRIHFGELATGAKGMKGLDPATGLTPAAAKIMKEMKGYRAPSRLEEGKYPSKTQRTFRTVKELRKLLAKRRAAKKTAAETETE
jgi:hypothetical protein